MLFYFDRGDEVMEQKEMNLVVTAKWVDEDGKEYEKNMQIKDIIHQQSIVIELKTVENKPVPIIEEKQEQIIFPEMIDVVDRRMYIDMFPNMMDRYQIFKKNPIEKSVSKDSLNHQRMSAYYMCNMQAYWEYYAVYAVGQQIKKQEI